MKIVVIILVCLIVLIVSIYGYYGGFRNLSYQLSTVGGETIVFENVKGDYRQSGEVSDRVYYSLLDDYKIDTYKGFGIYYDKPGKVKTEELRSKVGCIVEDEDIGELDKLDGKFEIEKLNNKETIIVEFPYRGRLSSFVGILKVHPYLDKVSKEENAKLDSPVMEIWDIPNKKLIYRKSLN